MCTGEMPGLPMIMFGVVDNRDVVDLHLRAMTHPAAKGERFLACAGDFLTFPQFAQVSIPLRTHVAMQAHRDPDAVRLSLGSIRLRRRLR